MISAPSSLTGRDAFRQSHPPGMTHRSTNTNRRGAAQLTCALAALVAALVIVSVRPAAADFRVCNNTSSRVGVAIGYKDKEGWATEGWWNLPSRSGCEVVLR